MLGYVTGPNNQLLSDGVFDYAYDHEGNRTLRTEISTGATTEYQWDHRNRLVKIVERDGSSQITKTVDYAYDVFDRRIQKSIAPAVGPAEVEQYVHDGVHMLLRFENGSLTNRYLHGPAVDQILADEQLDPSTGQTDRLLWPLMDNLGTIRDIAEYDAGTGDSSVVNHLVYDAFGRITSESDPSIEHAFAYTGRDRDTESDLYYYRARYYDPATGRFVSEDPIGFAAGDGNLSRYVGNGAVNAVDPSGLIVPGLHWYNSLWADGIEWLGDKSGLPAVAGATAAMGSLIRDSSALVDPVKQAEGIVRSAEDAVVDYRKYREFETDCYSSAALAVGRRVPIAKSIIATEEIASGQSSRPDDINTPLAAWGYANRVKIVGLDTAETIVFYGGVRSHVCHNARAKTLTAAEKSDIQAIANKYDTTIDVVGSRAAGRGRNIDTDLPVGKDVPGGPQTRSDIDFRIDHKHPNVNEFIAELEKVGKGAGNASVKHSTNPAGGIGRETFPPFERFSPQK